MKQILLALLILLSLSYTYAASCPSLVLFNETGNSIGYIANSVDCPECLGVARRHDLNCRGLNQTFPSGTYLGFPFSQTDESVLVVYDRRKECEIIALACGFVDAASTVRITVDTLFPIYSVSKIFVTMGLTYLLQNGRFTLTENISNQWTNFANSGKTDITVEQRFSNGGGVPYIKESLLASDFAITANRTAIRTYLENRPRAYYSPSNLKKATFGYDPLVWGDDADFYSTFVDASGRTLEQVIQQQILAPLNATVYFGVLPNQTSVHSSIAEIEYGVFPPSSCESKKQLDAALADSCSISFRAIANPASLFFDLLSINTVDGRNVRRLAGYAFTDARSIAKALLAFSKAEDLKMATPIFMDSAVEDATDLVFNDTDAHSFNQNAFSTLGLQLQTPVLKFSPKKKAYGHPGAAGSMAFADNDLVWVYNTKKFSGSSCDQFLPFNTYSLYYTYHGWSF